MYETCEYCVRRIPGVEFVLERNLAVAAVFNSCRLVAGDCWLTECHPHIHTVTSVVSKSPSKFEVSSTWRPSSLLLRIFAIRTCS